MCVYIEFIVETECNVGVKVGDLWLWALSLWKFHVFRSLAIHSATAIRRRFVS